MRWIGLLKGVNVGGNHILPMKAFAAALETAGFENVRTYIQSGNIVFDHEGESDAVAIKVSDIIEAHFSFRAKTWVFSREAFLAAYDNNPYLGLNPEGKTQHFFFLDKAPDQINHDLLDSLKAPSESYSLIDRVFYLYAPDGIGRSKLVEKLGKAVPADMTARNLNTVQKLLELSSQIA